MSLEEILIEEGCIKESENEEFELTSHTKILLTRRYSDSKDMETAIMRLCEDKLSVQLSDEEVQEVVEIVKPLADEVII